MLILSDKYVFMIMRLLFVAFGFLLSCQQETDRSAPVSAPAPGKMQMTGEESRQEEALPTKKIRNGQIRLVCADAMKTAADLRQEVARLKGFIENENVHHAHRTYEVYLQLRIPADRLETFMDHAAGLALRVENRSVGITDITEIYADTDARLRNKKALEVRYLEILKAAKNVEEILAIERELHQVRADIESMETQIKNYDQQVALSQVTVSCVTYASGSDHFLGRMREALANGWSNLLDFLVFLSEGWAVLLMLVAVFSLFRWWRRRAIKTRR